MRRSYRKLLPILNKINGVILLGLLFSSCELFQIKQQTGGEENTREPLARVDNTILYKDDLIGITSETTTGQDSIKRVDQYIKNWIKKQLLIAEASSKIDFDQVEIERKILDYRYALMIYEYEKFYVNQHLDKSVSEDEIKAYYKKNIENFELKQNIIKGIFVKLPKEAPNLSKFKRLLRSIRANDRAELRSYCLSFASAFSLEDTVWINFDEIIQNTPLIGIPNKVQFLKNNKYIEADDEKHYYFLNIYEYKITDETSPLEFVKDDIENIIINTRKIALANQLEEEIYERAQRNNDFEIYRSK